MRFLLSCCYTTTIYVGIPRNLSQKQEQWILVSTVTSAACPYFQILR
jgi:hypothetical protein